MYLFDHINTQGLLVAKLRVPHTEWELKLGLNKYNASENAGIILLQKVSSRIAR